MHRDHLLPVGQLVRMPSNKQVEEPPARRITRSVTQQKQKRDSSRDNEELQESSDSSSEWGCAPSHTIPPWRELVPRVTNTDRPTVDVNDDHLTDGAGDHSSQDDDLEMEHDDDLEADANGSDDPDAERHSKADQDSIQHDHSSGPDEEEECGEGTAPNKTEPRPKRTVKPTIRLTYDKLGRSRDQPLTILHRGIVIKIRKY